MYSSEADPAKTWSESRPTAADLAAATSAKAADHRRRASINRIGAWAGYVFAAGTFGVGVAASTTVETNKPAFLALTTAVAAGVLIVGNALKGNINAHEVQATIHEAVVAAYELNQAGLNELVLQRPLQVEDPTQVF
jgi:hypothetical protein